MKNKLRYCYFVLLVCLLILLNNPLSAEAAQLTAQSFGMGGAFTAAASGVEASLFNPAAIVYGKVSLEFGDGVKFYNTDQLSKLREVDGNIDNDKVKDVTAGISDDVAVDSQIFFGARLQSLGLVYDITDGEMVNQLSNNQAYYKHSRISQGIITYGRYLINPPLDLGALSYGFNFKLININKKEYDIANNVERRSEGDGLGIDLGLLAKVTDNLKIGCTFENLLVSKIALKGIETKYSYQDDHWETVSRSSYSTSSKDLKRNVRLGAALHIPLVDMTMAVDIDDLFDKNNGQVVHCGIEKNILFNGFSIRAGLINGKLENMTTLGFGLNIGGLHIDLAAGRNNRQNHDLNFLLSANIAY